MHTQVKPFPRSPSLVSTPFPPASSRREPNSDASRLRGHSTDDLADADFAHILSLATETQRADFFADIAAVERAFCRRVLTEKVQRVSHSEPAHRSHNDKSIHLPAATSLSSRDAPIKIRTSDREKTDTTSIPELIVFPEDIVRVMRNRMNAYIPLSAITRAKCDAASTAPIATSFDKPIALDESEEYSLTPLEYVDTYPLLILCVRTHYPGSKREALASRLEAHFSSVRNHCLWPSRPDIMIRYCIHVRRSFQSSPLSLGSFQEPMLSVILYNEALQIPATPSSATESRRERQRLRSASPPRTKDRRNELCLACGAEGHTFYCCKRPALYVKYDNTGKWLTPERFEICFAWNNSRCHRPACSRIHECSLCGSSAHRAPSCSRG
jgi:hypothetical protein